MGYIGFVSIFIGVGYIKGETCPLRLSDYFLVLSFLRKFPILNVAEFVFMYLEVLHAFII